MVLSEGKYWHLSLFRLQIFLDLKLPIFTVEPKPWTSFSEQISQLERRGLTISDKEVATQYLYRIGYYRLSGYAHSFYKLSEGGGCGGRIDEFIDGASFENIIDLYVFDRKLRLLVLDALERIEIAIQVEVSHLLGERDVFAHLDPKFLHTNFSKPRKNKHTSRYDDWLKAYNRQVQRAANRKVISHNIAQYGKLPIWVAMQAIDFGLLSRLYAGMRMDNKLKIESQFGLNTGTEFETWLRSLNFIRNTAAHHSRLWNCNVLERSYPPRQQQHLIELKNERPFLYFCFIKIIMDQISPNATWGQRFIDLIDQLPRVDGATVSEGEMGAVEGWRHWPLWACKNVKSRRVQPLNKGECRGGGRIN